MNKLSFSKVCKCTCVCTHTHIPIQPRGVITSDLNQVVTFSHLKNIVYVSAFYRLQSNPSTNGYSLYF